MIQKLLLSRTRQVGFFPANPGVQTNIYCQICSAPIHKILTNVHKILTNVHKIVIDMFDTLVENHEPLTMFFVCNQRLA